VSSGSGGQLPTRTKVLAALVIVALGVLVVVVATRPREDPFADRYCRLEGNVPVGVGPTPEVALAAFVALTGESTDEYIELRRGPADVDYRPREPESYDFAPWARLEDGVWSIDANCAQPYCDGHEAPDRLSIC
jgi:hypothetical protein